MQTQDNSHMITHNFLLDALPESVKNQLAPHLFLEKLPLGKSIYESGSNLDHVLFPTTAIISLLYVLDNGDTAEVAVVGNEGVVGITLFLGGATMPNRAIVQSAGEALRLSGKILQTEFNRGGNLHNLLLKFTLSMMNQMAQTAICNRHHTIDQQLCRWLLLSLDRLPTNELVMTQELIADMLGVRREGVTQAAGKLQAAGLIRYHRGHITVLNRPGLEARVCECYDVVRSEFDRLINPKKY
jgi:CRP-like cAMP-binding protein